MSDLAGDVSKYDDRKLQPLRTMHRHHAYAFGTLFVDRGLRLFAFLSSLKQFLNEAAERNRTSSLILPCQFCNVQDVGQSLLPTGTHDEASMSACSTQQLVNGLGYWDEVPPSGNLAQNLKGTFHVLQRIRNGLGYMEGMPVAELCAVRQQIGIADGKQRAMQGGIDGKRVVWPL